jgi:hypothetical protein
VKPFGFRVAILLECDLIDDLDSVISRKIFNYLIALPTDFQQTLNHTHLQKYLFDEMENYLKLILEKEHPPIQSTSLLDVSTFFRIICLSMLYF